jgi:hypothetical protein
MSFSTLGNFGRNAGIRAVEFPIRDQIFARYTTPDSASAFLKRAGSASIERHPEQSALENPSRQRPGTAPLLGLMCRGPMGVDDRSSWQRRWIVSCVNSFKPNRRRAEAESERATLSLSFGGVAGAKSGAGVAIVGAGNKP